MNWRENNHVKQAVFAAFVLLCEVLLAASALSQDRTSIVDPAAVRAAFLELNKKSEDDVVDRSLMIIEEAGIHSFPTLLKELGNETPASARFVTMSHFRLNADTGEREWTDATLGEVAFSLIQGTIEPVRPLPYRKYQVLTPTNVEKWLKARPELTLEELRISATQEAMRRIRSEIEANPTDTARAALEFFAATLERLEEARSAE